MSINTSSNSDTSYDVSKNATHTVSPSVVEFLKSEQRKTLQALRGEISTLRDENADLNYKLACLQDVEIKYEASATKFNALSCEKEQELQALYSKVDTLVEANNSLQKKLLTMETELADKVSVIKQLNNQISELGVRCHQLETNNEELRKENKQYSERQVDLVFKMRNILVKQHAEPDQGEHQSNDILASEHQYFRSRQYRTQPSPPLTSKHVIAEISPPRGPRCHTHGRSVAQLHQRRFSRASSWRSTPMCVGSEYIQRETERLRGADLSTNSYQLIPPIGDLSTSYQEELQSSCPLFISSRRSGIISTDTGVCINSPGHNHTRYSSPSRKHNRSLPNPLHQRTRIQLPRNNFQHHYEQQFSPVHTDNPSRSRQLPTLPQNDEQ